MLLSNSSSSPFPRRPPVKSNQGLIKPTYAGVFDLSQGGFNEAKDTVLKWLKNHRTVRAHAGSLLGDVFELDRLRNDGLLVQASVTGGSRVFVARLQHREPAGGDRTDPARNWRTDITVEHDDQAAWIATRIWFAGVSTDVRSCAPPNFIKTLWENQALSDLDILQPKIRRLEYEAEADALADLILDDDRDLPVVVLADGSPLDADRLARDSIGLAHVLKLANRDVRFRLMRTLGYKYELVHGSVQTFYPRVDRLAPFAPASRFETVIGWRFNELEGPPAFAAWLHEEMGRAVVLRLLNDPAHRTIESVKVEAIEAQRSALSATPESVETLTSELAIANELVNIVEAENDDLQKQLVELTARAEQWRGEKTLLEDQLRAETERNASLQKEKASLLYALGAKNGSATIELNPLDVEGLIAQQPSQLSVFDAVDNAKSIFGLYGANVVVSETALEAAMESPFLRPNDILAALPRLGFLWKEIRDGEGATLSERAREKLGCWCSLRESEPTMTRFASERRFQHDGCEVVLQKHLTLGGGRQNDTTTAQIYFGDKDGQLLIGHVGRHLTTMRTQ